MTDEEINGIREKLIEHYANAYMSGFSVAGDLLEIAEQTSDLSVLKMADMERLLDDNKSDAH